MGSELTNVEGFQKYGGSWQRMDEVHLRAYIEWLILVGVYRSQGKAAASLWYVESRRTIFRATMQLKMFHTYSTVVRFDDRESRPARCATDKLGAISHMWDEWRGQLQYLYNPR